MNCDNNGFELTNQIEKINVDRINVRGLFNTLERSLAKMAKYQVMEFNDNFTRKFCALL